MPLSSPLSERFADVPLILCGPIVRRVEPEIVSVWVALKSKRDVILELYDGYRIPSSASFPEKQVAFASQKTPSIQIGERLHLSLITIETKGLLTHGAIFSYNLLFFEGTNESENLISLGLLEEPELLGFKKGQLPSFVTAPEKLEDLRIAHGSCRKPHGRGRDGLAILARIMQPDFTEPDRVNDPKARPHYFFHTGDQIYADDCSNFLIQLYNDAGNFLLQKVEELPFPRNADLDYSKQTDKDEDFLWIEATSLAFPPQRRATNFYSGLTGDQSNHLYSLAEFCAAYLFQWCDVLWPAELPTAKEVFKDRIDDDAATRTYLFPLKKEGDEDSGDTPDVPSNWNEMSRDDRTLALIPEPTNAVLVKAINKYAKDRQQEPEDMAQKEREKVEEFRGGLKAVRRALANTPSIMSFDDHDVTDDWYLNGGWTKQALGTRLGETIIRNGLLAFALFQAWGNDPKGWADKTVNNNARSKLLEQIPKLVGVFKPLTPDSDIIRQSTPPGYKEQIDAFHIPLGFAKFDGQPSQDPRVKWHSFLKIGSTRVFILDTRTRRDFSAGLNFPPNLIAKDALAEQIPENAMPFGTELAIVVSGAPVLGLAAIENIGQPIISRVLDVVNAGKEPVNVSKREARHKGSHSLDVEHWSIHVAGFEAMLKRCAALKTVMFLAGDVHYGITSEMDYWEKEAPEAARFVQMVSSSLKNIKPEGQLWGVLPSSIAQLALSGGLNREFAGLSSIGWEREEDIKKLKLRVQTEPGQFEDARQGHFPLRIAYAMAKQPVLIPLRDWPLKEYEPVAPATDVQVLPRVVFKKDIPEPSFRWKMNVLFDERPDTERFLALSEVFPNLIADLPKNDTNGDAYRDVLEKIVLRQNFLSRNHINRFVNWYSHVAIIHFDKREDEMVALHSLFFSPQLPPPDNLEVGKFETPFFRHEVSLRRKSAAEKPAFPLEP